MQIRGGVCVKVLKQRTVLKQRMAFCNFPLAAAERCERVNVDVYAPRNMRILANRPDLVGTVPIWRPKPDVPPDDPKKPIRPDLS